MRSKNNKNSTKEELIVCTTIEFQWIRSIESVSQCRPRKTAKSLDEYGNIFVCVSVVSISHAVILINVHPIVYTRRCK